MRAGGIGDDARKAVMSPLFPRLHVNDADKGGPRAPPRNKMALYEQFTIHSQKSNAKAPSTSSCGQEGAIFSSRYLLHTMPSYPNKEVHIPALNTESSKDSLRSGVEKSSLHSGTNRSFKLLKMAGHYSPSSMDSSSFPFQDMENSCRKRARDEDDFRVPTFIHSQAAIPSNNDQFRCEKSDRNRCGDDVRVTSSSPSEICMNSDKPTEKLVPLNSLFQICKRVCSQKKVTETVKHCQNLKQLEFPKKLEGRTAEPSSLVSFNCDDENPGMTNLDKEQDACAKICCASGNDGGVSCNFEYHPCSSYLEDAEKGELSRVQISEAKNSTNIKTFHGENDVDVTESLREKYDEIPEDSEACNLELESGYDISPDEVAEMIGAKHFWKARRVILNQQRVFARQVFELHRLIKVQKLLASSPDLLSQGGSFVTRPSTVDRRGSSETTEKLYPLVLEKKDSKDCNDHHALERVQRSPSPLQSIEQVRRDLEIPENKELMEEALEDSSSSLCENIGGTLKPSPNRECNLEMEGSTVQSGNGIPHGNFSAVSTASGNLPTPWYHPPPANQWLIPVMSPAEGLVYKPYMGCPPSMGFMPSVFGGGAPFGMPPIVGTCGFPMPYPQNAVTFPCAPIISPTFYPFSSGFPFASPHVSGNAYPTSASLCMEQKEETGKHFGSSHVLGKPRVEVLSVGGKHVGTSRAHDLHDDMGSNPCGRLSKSKDSVPLSVPTQVSDSSHNPQAPSMDQSGVIKVVPHNPRRATESAVRIFKCIQQERQLCGSV